MLDCGTGGSHVARGPVCRLCGKVGIPVPTTYSGDLDATNDNLLALAHNRLELDNERVLGNWESQQHI